MKPITLEDIDSLAQEIKEKFCTYTKPRAREQFEYDIFQCLKETLDPWRTCDLQTNIDKLQEAMDNCTSSAGVVLNEHKYRFQILMDKQTALKKALQVMDEIEVTA